MTRAEVSGYVQIVIGAIGIVVTILASPAMLDAIGQMGGSGNLPPEFTGISGAVRIFAVLFVMFCFALLLVIGLSMVLSTVFRVIGSGHPFLTSLFAVMATLCLSVTVTLAVLHINYWITGFLAFGTLFWMCFASTAKPDEDSEAISGIAGIAAGGSILFLICGAVTVLANAAASREDYPPVRALENDSTTADRSVQKNLRSVDDPAAPGTRPSTGTN